MDVNTIQTLITLSGENVSQDVSQKSDESIENPSDEVENK